FVLCFPWTWKFRDVARAGWMEDHPSLNFVRQALTYYPGKLVLALGVVLFFALPAGVWARCLRQREPGRGLLWPVFAAALLSLLLFHVLVPCGLEERHLLPALPLAVCFAAAGLHH